MRVVVTGAGGGIGAAIAARLVREGADVVVNDLDGESCARTAHELGATALPGDAASDAGVAALIDGARARLGGIDVYFANAGVDVGGDVAALETAWELALQVNVLAHVRAARLLVPMWLEHGGGRFVVTASAAGLLTMLGSAPYSVTKHAAVAFAEWLSITYGHRGVVVQAICPQGVRTRMLDEAGPAQLLLEREAPIDPEDVADAVWSAMQDDRFLILPHPQVAQYYALRANDTDRWLAGMRKLQRRLDAALDSGVPGE